MKNLEAARLNSERDEIVEYVYKIDGLDCADCASKLESAVRRLDGIVDVQVNFTAAKMKVSLNTNLITSEEVLNVVMRAGYSAMPIEAGGSSKTVFRVKGLDCADCAAKLERKISDMPGVMAAKLNFGAGKLVVEHTLTAAEIIKAITQAGYEAVTENEAFIGTEKKAWWKKGRVLTTGLSGVFLLAAMILGWSGYSEVQVTVLYMCAMFVGGYHLAKSGLYSLLSFTLDMNFLMTVAAVGAGAIGEWSEGATVVFLFSFGNVLQTYTMDKARKSIRALMDIAPREALVRRNGQELKVATEKITVGDVLVIRPGERIAMDGIVASGSSGVNQASITGESMPVLKKAGDMVYAGTINEEGALEVTVTKLIEDSTLAKILHLVEEAQAQKAPSQQFVDKFAKVYTPVVIIGALLLMVVPWLLFNQSFSEWFYKALVMLVISCPCALVISTPVSIVSAIGNASKYGVLIKGGTYLEQMGTMDAIAFDKTGTLTIGKPTVTDVIALNGADPKELLILAASIEKKSEHPLAQAIVKKAQQFTLKQVEDFKAIVGRGAQGKIGAETIYVGNLPLFLSIGIDTAPYERGVAEIEEQGKTVMLVGSAAKIYGLVAVADILRENSAQAIKELRAIGIKHLAMLTGDNQRLAAVIAEKLDIDTVLSELLPEGKVAALKGFAKEFGSVIMVGDGVNDAPALATADIGIAMGVAGSDTALETADIALMADDLGKLSYTIRLSRKMMRIIRQNISFSIIVKAIFLLGTLAGFVNLWFAVFADTGAAILVTLNGMRLVRVLK